MLYILILLFSFSWSQVIDDFSDGELSNSPTWIGDVSSWTIVDNSTSGPNETGSMTLRLDAPADGSISQYMSFQPGFSFTGSVVWGAWMGRRSASSYTSANNTCFYIWSNSSNLKSDTLDAYRLIIGDNSGDDDIVLQRIDNGIPADIILGSYPVTNGASDISILVRIFRSQTAEFSLHTSDIPVSGDGPSPTLLPTLTNTPVFQGSATDATYDISMSGYVGILANHSTSSDARTAVEFDQVYIEANTDQSLPVFISSFTAEQSLRNVHLAWTTESETDNLGFELLRHKDNSEQKMISSYRYDSRLSGAGSTTHRSHYSFLDGPLETGHKYTYTLQQVDRDRKVNRVGTTSLFLSDPVVNNQGVYPNPSRGKILVNFSGKVSPENITLYNLLGQSVSKNKYRCRFSNGKIELSLGRGLSGGYYIANIKGNETHRNIRFLYMP